jgi:hypothetical protein
MIYQGMPQDGNHVRIVSPRPFSLFRIRDNSGQWQTPLFSSLLRHPHFLGDNSGLSQSTASPLYSHTLLAWATATPRPFSAPPCRELQSTFVQVAKLVEAGDLKSSAPKGACWFKSSPGHFFKQAGECKAFAIRGGVRVTGRASLSIFARVAQLEEQARSKGMRVGSTPAAGTFPTPCASGKQTQGWAG